MVREILSGGDSRAGVHHGPQPALDHLLPSRRPLDFRSVSTQCQETPSGAHIIIGFQYLFFLMAHNSFADLSELN